MILKSNSAPGPNAIAAGIKRVDRKRKLLSKCDTLWLATDIIPCRVKKCQSFLIPVEHEEEALKYVRSWRPLSIDSNDSENFSSIMTAHLVKACPLHDRQSGFIADWFFGELEVKLLELIMKRAKNTKPCLEIILVDVATKPFKFRMIWGLWKRCEDCHVTDHLMADFGT